MLLGYLTEKNDDKTQMMVSMLGELYKRADRAESVVLKYYSQSLESEDKE